MAMAMPLYHVLGCPDTQEIGHSDIPLGDDVIARSILVHQAQLRDLLAHAKYRLL